MSSNASSQDKQSLHFILRSGLAGGTAGCLAKTVVAPLDRVKILFQTSNPDFQKYTGSWSGAFRAGSYIYQTNGLRGLFQGHSATLLRVFPYAAIKFMAYDQIHHALMPTRERETNSRRFIAGALSGMVSVFFTYPLEVIRVRMAFQTPSNNNALRPSFSHAFSQIYNESTHLPQITPTHQYLRKFPLLKFYRGFTVTITGMIPYAGVSFLTWGFLHAHLDALSTHAPSPIADLAIGALSGAIAQTTSYPFEVTRRRMQVGGLTRPDRWLRWNETIRTIWNSGGWRAFYVGLTIGYLKVVPMTAVSFTAWQSGKRLLGV